MSDEHIVKLCQLGNLSRLVELMSRLLAVLQMAISFPLSFPAPFGKALRHKCSQVVWCGLGAIFSIKDVRSSTNRYDAVDGKTIILAARYCF